MYVRPIQQEDCDNALIASARVVAGLTLSEITYPPGLVLPQHSHQCAGFCLVLKGTYAEDYNNRTLSCQPQTVTFSPAGAQHSNYFYGAGSHCFTIDVEPQWLDRLREYGLTLDRPADFRGGALDCTKSSEKKTQPHRSPSRVSPSKWRRRRRVALRDLHSVRCRIGSTGLWSFYMLSSESLRAWQR
jgi:quercetin dioxygenase-like cupin family protein